MADIVQLQDRTTGTEEFPITLTEAVVDSAGTKLSDTLSTVVTTDADGTKPAGSMPVWSGTGLELTTQSGKGSATNPIYIDDGIATPCTYQLNKTVPSDAVFTDTKNTAGSTASTSKLFLIGAASQAASPQTYSNAKCFVGTDGHLYSNGVKVAPLASPALTGTPTAPTAATGTNTTQIATTAFVQAAVTAGIASNDAMRYMGTIAGVATTSSNLYGAFTPAASKGDTYKVTAAGAINGCAVEVGDMLICNTDGTAAATSSTYATVAAKWDIIQTNIDGAVTAANEGSRPAGSMPVWSGNGRELTTQTGKGSATNPIYLDDGIPTACSYQLNKTVPSNAVFTDTDTKVTSAANHYGYSSGAGATTGSNASSITYGTTKVITSVTLDDAKHVTALTTATLPAANNYSLPTASSSTLGGVKIGTTMAISSGVINVKDGAITEAKLATALSSALNLTAVVKKTGITAPTVTW